MAGRLSSDDLADALRLNGLRVTPQRLVIHRVLGEIGGHATADQVLERVEALLPNVSLPTVYATLALFERLGAVHRVSAPGDRAVYDTRTDPHHHVYCRVCGGVVDLDAPVDLSPAVDAANASGFGAEWVEVTLTGVCRSCADVDAN